MNELGFRLLAQSILSQVVNLLSKLIFIEQLTKKETLNSRIRVKFVKTKKGLKQIKTTLPVDLNTFRKKLLSSGFIPLINYLTTSLSCVITQTERNEVIEIIQNSESLRITIPVIANAKFNIDDVFTSIKNIKRGIKTALLFDNTELSQTNKIMGYLSQESLMVLNFLTGDLPH